MGGTYAALLRGINVGGRTQISMPELEKVFASLGFGDVTTYIRSGNVVFRAPAGDERAIAASIEERVVEAFGLPVAVLLRTPAELGQIAAANPFLGEETAPIKLHVVFLDRGPAAEAAAELDPGRSPPDRFSVRGREIYLHLPNGAGRSKLSIDYFERRLGVKATARNWNTVLKLLELAGG